MSDWGGLGGFIKEAQEIERAERQRDMVDCPVCGLLLDENAAGAVNCRMGHFRASVRPKVLP